MLESVGSDLAHVVHVNIFLKEMGDFEAMNVAYIQRMGEYQPAKNEGIVVTDRRRTRW